MKIKVKGYTATRTNKKFKTKSYKVKSYTKNKGKMGSNQHKKK